MKPERWQQLEELFDSALKREPEMRAHFLDEACADDQQLRKEVEALIVANEQAVSFIEKPALEIEARSLANAQSDAGAESMGGKTIGHYRLIALLGSGGMGEVYLAHDKVLGRKVALKLLTAAFTEDSERLLRFEQEARAASALNHPNIVTIHEIGREGSFHFIAQEFVDGVTLSTHLVNKRPTLSEALEIAMQVASALAATHAKGIVHRDIKPENIMVAKSLNLISKQRCVKVLDFGVAKLTQPSGTEINVEATTRMLVKTGEGRAVGTAAYMSPEQARGESVDARTDIWSLGVVLYEMVNGKQPFAGDTSQDVIASILRDELPSSDSECPESLKWIVKKALRKDREERYQTARELLTDLRGLLHEGQLEAASDRFGESVEAAAETRKGTSSSATKSALSLTVKGPNRTRVQYKRVAFIALVSCATLVLAAIAYHYSTQSRESAIESLAILPFVNDGGDSETEYLSDGLAETLINSLSQLPRLRVVARTTVFRYKTSATDPQKVGRELGVQAVLTGKVLQRGENLIIQADLVNVADGSQLWGQQYSRQLSDLVVLQNEIAKEISGHLRLRLSGEEQKRVIKHYTDNPDAYQLYLKGIYHANKFTKEGAQKAIEIFNQAIERDPNYALAYAGLADAYYSSSNMYVPPAEAMPKARAAAMKALALDDTLAEAHNSLGIVKLFYDWEFPGAEREFQRAIELNPGMASAPHWYAVLLVIEKRFEEAFREIKRAQELDPLSLIVTTDVGWVLTWSRQYDQAIEQYQKALELDQHFFFAHFGLGITYKYKGAYKEAVDEFTKATMSGGPDILGALGHTYAVWGKTSEAQEALMKLKERQTRAPISMGIAAIYIGLGEKDQAFLWLDRAVDERAEPMIYLNVDPLYDPIRSDPRFTELQRRVGLRP